MPIEIQNKEIRGITLKQAISLIVSICLATAFVVGTYISIKSTQNKTLETVNSIQQSFKELQIENKATISLLLGEIKDLRNEVNKAETRQFRFEIIMKEKGLMPYAENP